MFGFDLASIFNFLRQQSKLLSTKSLKVCFSYIKKALKTLLNVTSTISLDYKFIICFRSAYYAGQTGNWTQNNFNMLTEKKFDSVVN